MPQSQTQDATAPKTKRVEFEGETHEFPADFSDADISKALSTYHPSPSASFPAPAATRSEQPNSVIGGFVRRGVETAKGAVSAFAPPKSTAEAATPVLPAARMAKGVVAGESEGVRQMFKQTTEGKYGRAALTAVGLANPLTAGTTVMQNRLVDEGRYREAIGQTAFDVVLALLGAKSGGKGMGVAEETTINRLTAAAGGGKADIAPVVSELAETAKQTGPMKVVGDFHNVVDKTLDRLDQRFNQAMPSIAGKKTVPTAISDAITRPINTAMEKTAVGKELAKHLRAIAKDYQKEWSYRELNDERMNANGRLHSFYGEAEGRQAADMRTNAQKIADKAIADNARNLVYDELERANPGGGWRELKQKEGALIRLKERLGERTDKLADAQAVQEGTPWRSRGGVTGYAHAGGGLGMRLHSLQRLVGFDPGPEATANIATRTAFRPGRFTQAWRAEVLGLPVEKLAGAGDDDRKAPARMTPPPE